MANPNPKKAFVETGAGDVVEDGHLLGASYIAGDGAPPLPVFTAKVSAAEAVANWHRCLAAKRIDVKLRLIDHPHFAFGLDPGGCEVVDCAGPTACSCGTRHTFLELVWWVRVAHCAWLSFRGFPYFSGNDGCGVSSLPPAILPTYAFSARLIEGPSKPARRCGQQLWACPGHNPITMDAYARRCEHRAQMSHCRH
jgi:hypothetical protein